MWCLLCLPGTTPGGADYIGTPSPLHEETAEISSDSTYPIWRRPIQRCLTLGAAAARLYANGLGCTGYDIAEARALDLVEQLLRGHAVTVMVAGKVHP
jgi:hypothetical protein